MDLNWRLPITVIRLIGCGNMGSAIVRRLKLPTIAYDKTIQKAELLGKAVSSPLEDTNSDEVLLLAVKPQDFDGSLYKNFRGKLVISIMAGIDQKTLDSFFSVPALRAMPNLAVEYGCGIVALAKNERLDTHFIETLLAPLGHLEWFNEKQFPAITALTGSGPAFFLRILLAIEASALKMDLPPQKSAYLIKKMITGTLTWLQATDQSPDQLIKKVTSKGGITAAGLDAFSSKGVEEGIIHTFLSAFNKKIS